jgi:GSH-dependent disulfide-bond oxidoreductase
MIELHGMSSPNVRKVGILLEELGLDYTLHHVAVFRGDQFEPAFQAMSPLGKVPVLIDRDRGEGRPLIESGAILFYLAETYGAFLPSGGMDRYEVMCWVMVQMASIGPMFGQYNHFKLLGQQADPYAAARYRSQAQRLYQTLDERLRSREWLSGNAYSIADIATYPWALYLEQHGFLPGEHPALIRWRDTVGERAAVKRSWERFATAFNQETQQTRRTATAAQLDRFFGRESDAPPADYSAVTQG